MKFPTAMLFRQRPGTKIRRTRTYKTRFFLFLLSFLHFFSFIHSFFIPLPTWEAAPAQSEGFPNPCEAPAIPLETLLALYEALPASSVSEAHYSRVNTKCVTLWKLPT